MPNLNDAITEALKLAALAHIWHLTTKSYAEHIAFGELYEYMHVAADKMAEASQGAGIPYNPVRTGGAFTLTDVDGAVDEIEGYVRYLEALQKETKQPWLSNIIQEIQGNIYGILYKLKELG